MDLWMEASEEQMPIIVKKEEFQIINVKCINRHGLRCISHIYFTEKQNTIILVFRRYITYDAPVSTVT
jgi:hypothetical protein